MTGGRSTPSAAARPATVLVADDEPLIRELVRAILEPLGCRLVVAASGTEAWYLLRSELPAVAIVDKSLGDIDGLRLVQLMERSGALRHTRVVVLTGRVVSDDERAMIEAQCAALLLKPFRPAELLAVVERLLAET